MTLDQKALEAAANAYWVQSHIGFVCPPWSSAPPEAKELARANVRAAITAYLAALPPSPAASPSPPALDGAGREGLDRDEQLGITQYLLMQADIEVPDDDWPECVDLCDNRVCGAVGCLVSKYRRVRALKETR